MVYELRRRVLNSVMNGLAGLSVIVALVPLVAILVYVVAKGIGTLDWTFLTSTAKPVGEPGGGMGHALVGSLIMVGIASAIGIPVGLFSGIYLSEYGGGGRLATNVRFLVEVLAGVPSIVVGIFVYALVVTRTGGYSAYAGGVALAIMMIPLVTRTTEEMFRLVPVTLRDAALALGAPRWRATLGVVLKAAMPGIVTGVMLAVARVAGETAPLLFTALNSRYWPAQLGEPTASLTVSIYNYAVSPYQDWQAQAWAGSLLLILLVLVFSVVARLATRSRYNSTH